MRGWGRFYLYHLGSGTSVIFVCGDKIKVINVLDSNPCPAGGLSVNVTYSRVMALHTFYPYLVSSRLHYRCHRASISHEHTYSSLSSLLVLIRNCPKERVTVVSVGLHSLRHRPAGDYPLQCVTRLGRETAVLKRAYCLTQLILVVHTRQSCDLGRRVDPGRSATPCTLLLHFVRTLIL